MEINALSGSALTPEVQAEYAVKCIQMARESALVASSIIEDTAEISEEALSLCLAELEG